MAEARPGSARRARQRPPAATRAQREQPARTPNPTAGPAPRTPRASCSGRPCPPRPLTGRDAQLLGAPAEALHHHPAAEIRQLPHGPALRLRDDGAPGPPRRRAARHRPPHRASPTTGEEPAGTLQPAILTTLRRLPPTLRSGRARAACPECPPFAGGRRSRRERPGAGWRSYPERGGAVRDGAGRNWMVVLSGARSGAEQGGAPYRSGTLQRPAASAVTFAPAHGFGHTRLSDGSRVWPVLQFLLRGKAQ